MIPIRDHNPAHSTPLVAISLVIINVLVFLYEVFAVTNPEVFFYTYGLVPCTLTGQCALLGGAVPPVVALFTAMFMHGGWLHIAGNMLYLWIFGNNVEDNMGHGRFLVFYLLCGIAASLTQVAIDPESTIVNVGASGAIAGVLGAYAILFPGARVDTIVPFGFLGYIVALPALLVLGMWFVLQFFSGVMSLGMPASGGVAFWAHIGGFVAGILLLPFFRRRRRRPVVW